MSTQNQDLVVFFALVVLAAAWAALHLGLTLRAARTRTLATALRWLAWLPPVTPVAAYLSGAKLRAVLWLVLGVTYLVLRTRS